MNLSPNLIEILTIMSKANRPMTAAEIYDASTVIEKKQQVFSGCYSLRSGGLIEVIEGEEPKRYRITDAGRAALNGDKQEEQNAAPQSVFIESIRPATGHLANVLEQTLFAPHLPDGVSRDDCRQAADVIERLARVLMRRFGNCDDLELLMLAAHVLRHLSSNQEMEEAA